MNKKRNNKGFSLVELIVVMAIMAILAVTLAPKLVQYIDKARQAQDRESVNAIYTAVKYCLMDDSKVTAGTSELNDYTVTGSTRTQDPNSAYNVTAKNFVANASGTLTVLEKEIIETIPKFKLQSTLASDKTKITIIIVDDSNYKVILDYDGSGDGTDRYTLDSTTIY